MPLAAQGSSPKAGRSSTANMKSLTCWHLQCNWQKLHDMLAGFMSASQVCASAGVKLVLPAILQGVDDSAWRTKQGSIELLGTMAYLAPKQLSTSLPTVVPILGKTLSDPHPKVQASAKKALEEVCTTL